MNIFSLRQRYKILRFTFLQDVRVKNLIFKVLSANKDFLILIVNQ